MIEKINEKNFLKVITSVTVRDVHSVVKTNTELMHRYCVRTFPIK